MNPFFELKSRGIHPRDIDVLARAFTLAHDNSIHEVMAALRMAGAMCLPVSRHHITHVRPDNYHAFLDGEAFAPWHDGIQGFPRDSCPETVAELAQLAWEWREGTAP